MNNPFSVLPSYIKESPKFSKFLELVSGYLLSGALETELFKDAFLSNDQPRYVISSLAKQMGVEVELPTIDGQPDWNAYYRGLYYATRAKSFNSFYTGTLAELSESNTLNTLCKMSALDFAVAKGMQSPMTVLYSIVGYNNYLTSNITKDYLIPKITGVNSITYFVFGGEEVFGYDLDEITGKKVGPNGTIVDIEDGSYVVSNALISNVGSGYQVGDVVTVNDSNNPQANGVQLRIVDLSEFALMTIMNPTEKYVSNPTVENASVTGGSGTGMKVNVVGGAGHGYFIRGWDNGKFYTIL